MRKAFKWNASNDQKTSKNKVYFNYDKALIFSCIYLPDKTLGDSNFPDSFSMIPPSWISG